VKRNVIKEKKMASPTTGQVQQWTERATTGIKARVALIHPVFILKGKGNASSEK